MKIMNNNKIFAFLKYSLICAMLFLSLLETIMFFHYIKSTESFIYDLVKYFIQIATYFTLIAIVTVRKKIIWYIGVLYFMIACIDLFFWDFFLGIPRQISSGQSIFDFGRQIAHANFILKGSVLSYLVKIIYMITKFKFVQIIQFLSFPCIIVLFFSNFIRNYYGLLPIFKVKHSS